MLRLILLYLFTLFSLISFGQTTYYVRATGNWSAASTWSTAGCGGAAAVSIPGNGDDIVMCNARTLTVDGNYTCRNFTLGNTNKNETCQITTAGNSLTITGDLKINNGNQNNTFILDAGPGTINIDGTFSVWNNSTATNSIRVSTGQLNFTPTVNINNANKDITMRAGGTISFNNLVTHSAGTLSNTTAAGTINFNGGYTNSGGTFTSMANEIINFGGNFTNSGGAITFNANSFEYFVSGSPIITPTSSIAFGNLQVNSGITTTVGVVGGGRTVTVAGVFTIINTGIFDLGTSATNTFSVTGNSIIDGSLFFNGTTTKTVVLSGNLSGSGTIDLSSRTHTLELGGTSNSIGTLTTDANASIVRYNGTNQTIFSSSNYQILRVSNSGSTLGGNVTVNNQLIMSSGNIDLNSYTLRLGNGSGASLSYTTGTMYNGFFERYFPALTNITSTSGSFYGLFPIGTSSAYRPVEINSTAQATTGGYLIASHIDAYDITDVAYSDNQSIAIERISNKKTILSTSGLVGGTYNLNVTFTGLAPGTAGNLRLETFDGPPYGVGTHVATAGTDPTDPVLKRSGLSVSDFNHTFVAGTTNKTNTPIKRVFYSRTSGGNWTTNSTWSLAGCGGVAATTTPTIADDVVICTGYTVNVPSSQSCNNLEVQQNGVMNHSNNNVDVSIYGNLVCSGSVISANNNSDLFFYGTDISGTGVIDMRNNSTFTVFSNANILSGSNLIIANDLTIGAGANVTNNGTLYVGQDIVGANASSTFINSTNSKITVGRTMLTNGVLNAGASGNTVEYTGTTATQNVKTPVSSTYYNLTVSNDQNTVQQADLIIDGDININAGIYSCGGFNINIRGDWSNSSIFDNDVNSGTPIAAGTVIFDGSGSQNITNSGGESFFNLTIDKPVGTTIFLNDNISIRNILTMNKGNVNAGSNRVIVGYSTTAGQEGTLSYSAGSVIGEYQKYINASGSVIFPVGIATLDRPAVSNFTMSTAGSVIAKFISSPPGSNGLPLVDVHTITDVYNSFSNGYWSLVAADGFTTSSYNLELTGAGFDAFTMDAETRLLNRANSGSPWITEGLHVGSSGYTARRNNLTTFSGEYCFGDDTPCTRPATSAITGDNTVCVNDANIIYQVTDTPLSWYEWSLSPSSAGIISGNGSSLVSVTWGATGVDATLKVVERNTCTWGDTIYYSVTVGTVPPSSITGSANVPKGAVGKVYSVTNLGYTYTWSVVGGTITAGQGTSSVTVTWDDTEGTDPISVIASDATCGAAAPVSMNVRRYYIIKSVTSASWDNATTWDCNCNPLPTDNVQIRNHTVTLTSQNYTINNLTIDAGGTLSLWSGGGGTKTFNVDGDFVNNGVVSGTLHDIRLRGIGTKISGTGSFDQSRDIQITSGSKTIESASVLTVTVSNVSIAAGLTVTNYGSLSITASGKTLTTGGTWINMANSYLKVCNGIAPALDAISIGNTVEYGTSAANYSIKLPILNSYYNLKISGTNTWFKRLSGNTIVYGDFTISDDAKLDVMAASNFSLNIGGNWNNNSTSGFFEQLGTVTFDGSSDQTITCSIIAAGETFYNMVVSKTAGTIILANNVTASNSLTMTQGNIDAGANRITVGTAVGALAGTLSHTSGTIIGEYQKWTNGAGTYLFPLGTSTYYRPVNLTLGGVVTNGNLITKFVSADPAGTGLPLSESGISIIDDFNDGYWNFVSSVANISTSYNVSIDANGFTHGGAYALNAASRVIKSDNGAAYTLTGLGTHANASGSICYRNTITSAINNAGGSKFCIGHTDCPTFVAPVVTGNIDACKSSTEVYSVPNDATHTYSWIVSGGTTDPNPTLGQNTSSITVTWNAIPSATSYVSVTENSSCYSASTKLTVKKHALPTNAISGPNSVVDNSISGPYTVTARPGYTYTWSIAVGNGVVSSGQGTNSVYILWGNPSAATLRCVGQYAGCTAATNEDYSVTVYASFFTVADGDWSDPTIWNSNPNIPDNNNESAKVYHNVTINNASYTIKDLYIGSNGVTTGSITHGSGRDLTIEGNYINDGGTHDLTASNNVDVNLNSTLTDMTIGGAGGFIFTNPGNFNIKGMSHTVLATADLYFIGDISLGNSIILNNNGSIYITGDLNDATNPGSSWYNLTGSTLQIEGSVFPARGSLFANASNNTVVYTNGSFAPSTTQVIKTPNSNKYWNLYITGDGPKEMQANLDIDGNLTIDGTGSLDVKSGSNYSINIGGNWTNVSAHADPFVERLGTVTFDGNADQTLLNANGATFYNLIIASQGDLLRPDGDLTVTKLLTLTKGAIIISNPFKVIIPTGGNSNIGDDDSFVDGIVQRVGNTAFTFPVGDRTVTEYIWAPIGINNVTSGAGDNFEAQFFRTSPPNRTTVGTGINHISFVEYWNITPSNGGATADVILHWKDAARSGITDIASGDMAVAHWNGTVWEDKGGAIWGGSAVGAGADGYITTNLTSFSPVAHASKNGNNVLPVELIYFKAYLVTDNKVKLNWRTASEKNNDYFIVQKTNDFENIEDFDKVKGSGNSNLVNDYSSVDPSPYNGISYYRIAQIDYDGSIIFSNWVPIEVNKNGNSEILIYPNPLVNSNEFFVKFDNNASDETLIVVKDILGNELYSKVHILSDSGDSVIAIDLTKKLPSGIYLVIGTSRNHIYNKKLIIK